MRIIREFTKCNISRPVTWYEGVKSYTVLRYCESGRRKIMVTISTGETISISLDKDEIEKLLEN